MRSGLYLSQPDYFFHPPNSNNDYPNWGPAFAGAYKSRLWVRDSVNPGLVPSQAQQADVDKRIQR